MSEIVHLMQTAGVNWPAAGFSAVLVASLCGWARIAAQALID